MEKDIDYYLAHPDEVPDDMETLEAIAKSGELPAANPDTDETGAASGAQQDDAGEQVQQGEAPAPVLAKDGKHTIPYSVLEGSRKRADQAEQIAAQMQGRIAELEAQLKAPGTAGTTEDANAALPEVPAADMDMIRQEFPELATVIDAQSAQIKALQGHLEQQQVREQADQRTSVASMVQDTIDSIPKLAHIQAQNPALFKKAIELDNALMSDPDTAGLPLAERFSKVLSGVEAMYGVIRISGSETPQGKSKQDLAKEALGKARGAAPNSLSDLPSGAPPIHSEVERLASMAPADVGVMVGNMTDAQLDAFLNNL